jgi:hypothetical protein
LYIPVSWTGVVVVSTILDSLTPQCFKNLFFVFFRWKCGLDGILVKLVTSKELVPHWTADEFIVVKLASTHYDTWMSGLHSRDILIKLSKFNENVLLEVTPPLSYNLLLLIVTAVSHSC